MLETIKNAVGMVWMGIGLGIVWGFAVLSQKIIGGR